MLLKLSQDDIRTIILCRVVLLYFVVMLSYGTFKGLPDEKEALPPVTLSHFHMEM